MSLDPRTIMGRLVEYDETERSGRFRGKTVTLVIGQEKLERVVHEDLLTTNSLFFKAALNGDWQEGKTGIITLPEDLPSMFDLYINWLYQRKIFTKSPSVTAKGTIYLEQKILIKAFALGEKLQDDNFRDALIDAFIMSLQEIDKTTSRNFVTSMKGMVFESTPAGSPLRRVWAAYYVSEGNASWIEGSEDQDFLADLARALFDKARYAQVIMPLRASCHYHHHAENGPCYPQTSVLKRKRDN